MTMNFIAMGGIRVIAAAMKHHRGDKYLFANEQKYRCVSYRQRWIASRSAYTFETWLKKNGLFSEGAG